MGETAGYVTQLVDGLRAAGARADFLHLAADQYGYVTGPPPRLSFRIGRWLSRQRAEGRSPRIVWSSLHRLAMVGLFASAMLRYDAIILRAGDSFLGMRDLPIMRRLRKRVVIVFLGTDSRPSYMNGSEVASGVVGARAAAATGAKRRMVERIERDASAIVCHSMSAQLHRRPVIAFLEMGFPRRIDVEAVPPAPASGRAIRILHAPSRPEGKGTSAIRAAVDRVRSRGLDVELVVMHGRPNHEVIKAIGDCDFVVDELYSDTPMGGFAAEAAAFGRPAIVGGYAWEELLRSTRAKAMPPVHLCHPDALDEAISVLATDHTYRAALGARARRFVGERWSPLAVADRFLAVLADEASPRWFFDPAQLTYALGTGIGEDRLREVVRDVIDEAGREGLHVSDKPELERRLVDLAHSDGGR